MLGVRGVEVVGRLERFGELLQLGSEVCDRLFLTKDQPFIPRSGSSAGRAGRRGWDRRYFSFVALIACSTSSIWCDLVGQAESLS